MSKSRRIIILIAAVIVIICLSVAALFLIPDGKDDKDNAAVEALSTGQELFAKGDYESAIKYFEKAIELDPDSETAYRTLGMIYIELGDYETASKIWTDGYDRTGSKRLLNLVEIYIEEQGNDRSDNSETITSEEEKDETEYSINSTFFLEVSESTFSDYVREYGNASISESFDVLTAVHNGFAGEFYYSEYENGTSKIGSNGKPLDNALPDAITVDNISQIIVGFDGSISYEKLGQLGLIGLVHESDESGDYVSFKYGNCRVTIDCDENGNITSSEAENMIVPPQDSSSGVGRSRNFVVELVRAATGGHIEQDYTVDIAKAETVVSDDSMPLGSGDNIIYSTSTRNGVLEIELEYTEYCVCVYPDDNPGEFRRFTWNITEETTDTDLKLVIAEEVSSGQMIIVLKWGERPRDIDAYYISNDEMICYFNKNGDNAELDVDCVSGNGIETITVKDSSIDAIYYVNNYSGEVPMGLYSNAIVEVYTAGSTTPIVFTMPSDIEDIWEVFEIRDGEVIEINREADLTRTPGNK